MAYLKHTALVTHFNCTALSSALTVNGGVEKNSGHCEGRGRKVASGNKIDGALKQHLYLYTYRRRKKAAETKKSKLVNQKPLRSVPGLLQPYNPHLPVSPPQQQITKQTPPTHSLTGQRC
jgi:hypothetical protein